MKYTLQTCMFDNTTNTPNSMACANECSGTRPVLETAFTTNAPDCISCLRNFTGSVILGNFYSAMLGACNHKVDVSLGESLPPNPTLFDDTPVPWSSPTSDDSPSGISKDAKIGIGVGVSVVGLALIVGVMAYLVIRGRRSRVEHGAKVYGSNDLMTRNEKRDDYAPVAPPERHELDPRRQLPVMMDSREVHEIAGDYAKAKRRSEPRTPVAELDAGSRSA
ncbi:MAG: hypothetical protein M1828_007085 [Chrysothrix sp. TS-e1954]|nr:MAG: hypothetical protein M1828_007085 [Chrysothrix sp. TS-e1954]